MTFIMKCCQVNVLGSWTSWSFSSSSVWKTYFIHARHVQLRHWGGYVRKAKSISIVCCCRTAHKCGSDALSQHIDRSLWPLSFGPVNPLPAAAADTATSQTPNRWESLGEGLFLNSRVVTQAFFFFLFFFFYCPYLPFFTPFSSLLPWIYTL